ncbi:MAG TPA: DUF3347 domain-containing protein, partial [Candidatus Cloacimonetes bacterium]|nr:DUF3347 domain-containing protein [Candidatus Cloacimonadota bacterium]
MKKTMIMLSLALVSWGAFAQHDHSKMNHAEDGHSTMESMMKKKSVVPSTIRFEHSVSATAIIESYLTLKNELVVDNSAKAAESGKMVFEALAKYDYSTQSDSQKKELDEIIENAKEQAEHISENKGNIDHQREHFEVLSTDIKDLIATEGADRTLYQIYCPMY